MVSKATRERIKSSLIRHPRLFRAIRFAYVVSSNIRYEIIAIIRYVPKFSASLWRKSSCPYELPTQTPTRILLRQPMSTVELTEWAAYAKLPIGEGGDSIYLPPATWAASSLGWLRERYPDGTGLKIVKSPGGPDDLYISPRFGRSFPQKLSFSHRKQTLTFNFLHAKEIAPRLYDLIELQDTAGQSHMAYVVEHVSGETPLPSDRIQIIQLLKSLERDGNLALISGAGWGGIDFEEPDCNGNLLRSESAGRSYYVDVHNFILNNYENYLRQLAISVSKTSHFGNPSIVFGGAYLYHSIPGVNLPAKRSPEARLKLFDRMLADTGITLHGKVIFDIGCNLGLMGAEYLRRGAHWVHGWDRPDIVSAARLVLLGIGCTRFTLTPAEIDPDADLAVDVPDFLKMTPADDAVISYLAVRGHLGWLPAIAQLPWRHLLYEGHQNDGDFESYTEALNKLTAIRVSAVDRISDGVSTGRDVAVIERL